MTITRSRGVSRVKKSTIIVAVGVLFALLSIWLMGGSSPASASHQIVMGLVIGFVVVCVITTLSAMEEKKKEG